MGAGTALTTYGNEQTGYLSETPSMLKSLYTSAGFEAAPPAQSQPGRTGTLNTGGPVVPGQPDQGPQPDQQSEYSTSTPPNPNPDNTTQAAAGTGEGEENGENKDNNEDGSGSSAGVVIVILLVLVGLGVGAYFMFFAKKSEEGDEMELDHGMKSEV